MKWRRAKRDPDQVIRHTREVKATELAHGDEALMAAVEAHVAEHLGEVELVWHEIVSLHVHVDVLVVGPTPERPWKTLVTVGMSAAPMLGSGGDPLHAELVMALPPDWPLERPEGGATWPLPTLMFLARLPHAYDTVLWVGHTVPNDDPPRPYAPSTELCGALLAVPVLTPDAFDELEHDDHTISFLAVIPLHAQEMDFKLQHGADALYDRLDAAELSELLDERRPSVV
jgi:hypothetical protein